VEASIRVIEAMSRNRPSPVCEWAIKTFHVEANHAAEDTTMKADELPTCPHCQNNLKPDRINAVRYVCTCCAREFTIPKGS
jgi:transposase-like protein